MKKIFFLFSITYISFSQVSIKPMAYDSITIEKISNWDFHNKNNMKLFLSTFSDTLYEDNVEYSECANEILFHQIDSNPTILFSVLFSLSKKQIDAVAEEVLNPINDGIPVIPIYNRLKKSIVPHKLKQKALIFMKPSYEKQKKEIEIWERKNNKKWVYPQWK